MKPYQHPQETWGQTMDRKFSKNIFNFVKIKKKCKFDENCIFSVIPPSPKVSSEVKFPTTISDEFQLQLEL